MPAAIVVLFSMVFAAVPATAHAQGADDKALAVSLAGALASWMAQDRAANGGRFLLHDPDAGAVLDLATIKLDDGDHLHRLADGRFLSWGEFRDAAGHLYMIDFYFRRSAETFVFDQEITIFSRDGVKRYGWDETGPAMKKIPAK